MDVAAFLVSVSMAAFLWTCAHHGQGQKVDEPAGPIEGLTCVEALVTVGDDEDDETPKCTRYTFDPVTRQNTGLTESPCDGTVHLCTVKRYDENWNVVLDRASFGCDDTPNRCDETTWDDEGRMLTLYTGGACKDAQSGERTCSTFAYDENGDLARLDMDDGCDGTHEKCLEYEIIHDPAGQVVEEHARNTCGGTLLGLDVFHTHDEHGNTLTTRKVRIHEDLELEICTTWTYDERGNKLTEQIDEYCDGTPEGCTAWTWDSRGNMKTKTHDLHCDGSDPIFTTYEWYCF